MKEAILYKKINVGTKQNAVQCLLCSHYCVIMNGERGKCLTRKNDNGTLFTLTYGLTDGLAIDPVEKKPFFHFQPGTKVLSFGTPGCNFKCLNCQNSNLSHSYLEDISLSKNLILPEQIVLTAIKYNIDGIAYTYSEPTIFFEFARDTIIECKKNPKTKHLKHLYISNGYFSKETLDLIYKENLIDAINIDLKFMNNAKYKKITGGMLLPVLDSIKRVWEYRDKILLEVINLVIPDENDSDEDLNQISEFIASVSPEIPLHFSRFFPQNKMLNKAPTDLKRLIKAKEIAESHGLHYVYIGNTNIPNSENTYCPNCKTLLISRQYYNIINNIFDTNNNAHCPNCNEKINCVL